MSNKKSGKYNICIKCGKKIGGVICDTCGYNAKIAPILSFAELPVIADVVQKSVPAPNRKNAENDKAKEDNQIPLSFYMVVTDIFQLSTSELVLAGVVKHGEISLGDHIDVVLSDGKIKRTTIKKIEMSRKLISTAYKGDPVGIFVSDGTKNDYIGVIGVANAGGRLFYKQIKTSITVLTKEEDGKNEPIFDKFYPYFLFSKGTLSGSKGETIRGLISFELTDKDPNSFMLVPGKECKADVVFDTDVMVVPGVPFRIIDEASNKLATGVVLNVIDKSNSAQTEKHTGKVDNDSLSKEANFIHELQEKRRGDSPIIICELPVGNNHIDYCNGYYFYRGYGFIPQQVKKVGSIITFHNPYIFLSDEKLTAKEDVLPLINMMKSIPLGFWGPFVVIAQDIAVEVQKALSETTEDNCIVLKAPGYGDRRREMLLDIAILTGAKVFSNESYGKYSKNIGDAIVDSDLGRARVIQIMEDMTVIADGKGGDGAISERIASSNDEINASNSDWDKEKLSERRDMLSDGIEVGWINPNSGLKIDFIRAALMMEYQATK